MFTGLIQTTGTLQRISGHELLVQCDRWAERILTGLELGDSVSVDGVCLTVVQIRSNGFVADASPETLERSTLGRSMVGNRPVNLEPSLRVGSKLGGHFVTGHVDGLGYLESAVADATSWQMRFRVADSKVSRYIVSKGSIAINGISLTVADCNASGSEFMVAVIPLTYAETNLSLLQPGDAVNLEGDVLGKYVEKFLRLGDRPHSDSVAQLEDLLVPGGMAVSSDFLAEHGYL
ncbi:riboflavin synthase [Leptolyngbya sp. AN02str]|uniref:riboflavin synthase n=1 Tax=Leptolyngbya sp. AN02str TaxID=3423363 RepID=UPI003D31E5DB